MAISTESDVLKFRRQVASFFSYQLVLGRQLKHPQDPGMHKWVGFPSVTRVTEAVEFRKFIYVMFF